MINKIVAVQGNHPSKLNPTTDTSVFLANEIQSKKYKIFYYDPKDLSVINSKVIAKGFFIKFDYTKKKFFKILNKQKLDLTRCKFILIRQDPNMRHESAPKPRLTDADYRKDYLSDTIGIQKRLEWTEDKFFVTTEEEPLFDAADVLRFGKDLVVQHGFTTNLKGIDWLKRHYKDHRVHAVNFPGDPYPIHIDATFTPVKEGLIINNPQRRLPKEQRKLFEDNGWEIIDSAQPAHNEPPPLCYSSTWLSMNVLVLDPKTVCVEKSEVYQAEQLDKLGMEVVPVELRDAYAFGGGLHCCTADVYREGELKDYFPKQ
ncbi:hypothetical protein OAM33_01220 [Candidatus Pelagibacter sp.]|nr:hypothetical protein [Candidatus Pelagibacter sp.]